MHSRDAKPGWWAGWRAQAQDKPIGERILAARLDRLRRELRIHRILFAVVALVFAGQGIVWLRSPARQIGDTVRTHRVEVLAENGTPAVVLDADRIGGRIALRYNRGGTPSPPAMFLLATPEGGALQLFQPGHNYFALALELGDQGEGIVKVRRSGMQQGLELSGPRAEDQGGALSVFNADGRPAVTLGSDAQGRGVVTAHRDGG
jgi:hypothetical protein